MIFYPVISLCPAFTVSSCVLRPTHYCVQHIIVSNKILCPHLPKGSFVSFHISMCCGRIRLRLQSNFFSICVTDISYFADQASSIKSVLHFKSSQDCPKRICECDKALVECLYRNKYHAENYKLNKELRCKDKSNNIRM